MSNRKKLRSHPGQDMITVAWIAEEAWQAAGEPDDTEAWLNTLSYDQVDQVMRQAEVARDEFLRRMAADPDTARWASTAEAPYVMMIDLTALRHWWTPPR